MKGRYVKSRYSTLDEVRAMVAKSANALRILDEICVRDECVGLRVCTADNKLTYTYLMQPHAVMVRVEY